MAQQPRTMQPARTIAELFRTAQPEHPLLPGDPRYVAHIAGRGDGNPLRRLEVTLEQYVEDEDRNYAKLILTGHRGCGKTTELLRLEERFKARAFIVRMDMDESLRADFDYTLMLLWLTEELVHRLEQAGVSLPQTEMRAVEAWFAEITEISIESDITEGEAGVEVTAGAGASLFGFGTSFLARLKARLLSSREDRTQTLRKMNQRGSELIGRVNTLFIAARSALKKAGRPPEIVVIQDNLDRLERDVAARLFIDNGQLIKDVGAHMVITAPLALTLSPNQIETVFPATFSLATPKLHDRSGTRQDDAVESLRQVVLGRADVALFDGPELIERLVMASGGSFRDLMRLLRQAQTEARAADAATIGANHVASAIGHFRAGLVKALQPARRYFPALVEINRTKDAPYDAEQDADAARGFLRELIFIGAILEYNGDDYWYDVHPTLLEDRRFQAARPDAAS